MGVDESPARIPGALQVGPVFALQIDLTPHWGAMHAENVPPLHWEPEPSTA
jgi:hypothetical protein